MHVHIQSASKRFHWAELSPDYPHSIHTGYGVFPTVHAYVLHRKAAAFGYVHDEQSVTQLLRLVPYDTKMYEQHLLTAYKLLLQQKPGVVELLLKTKNNPICFKANETPLEIIVGKVLMLLRADQLLKT